MSDCKQNVTENAEKKKKKTSKSDNQTCMNAACPLAVSGATLPNGSTSTKLFGCGGSCMSKDGLRGWYCSVTCQKADRKTHKAKTGCTVPPSASTVVIVIEAGKEPRLRRLPLPKHDLEGVLAPIKSQIFQKPMMFLEHLQLSPTAVAVFDENPSKEAPVNTFMAKYGWNIRGHTVIYQSAMKGTKEVYTDLTDKDIVCLPETFAADRKRRAEHRAALIASGAAVVEVSL